MNSSAVLSAFVFCASNVQNFFILKNWNFSPINSSLYLRTSPWQLPLYFVSMSLTILDTSYKWNHIAFFFYDWLISLNIMSSRFIHVVTRVRFFLRLIILHHMYKLLFIYSFTCESNHAFFIPNINGHFGFLLQFCLL